ncbi:MAG: hypothetical protein CVU16_13865 [Betaproteobacteria bacterium HGW-Betaproteobacteria-10]|nr:MAG: hypothetical protein CVU16_13865 [Betaproteobacteria bacterium HGW-Betaproteobacteria-10]
MRLTLLVPELIWPEPADQFTLGEISAPGLAWLLAHAAGQQQPRRPFENVLADSFGLSQAPLAALRLLGENNEAARRGHWLCADPVHLRFHQERIILADAGAFELEDDEAQAIIAALNAEFADIGQFHAATARRWYLRLNATVNHVSAPISAVAGRRVESELPKGDSTLTRWLNEVQMFLHLHPINERRQAAGKPAVNSMWLWGAGEMGDTTIAPTAKFSSVWTDNPLAAGLARHLEIPLHAPAENLGAVFAAGDDAPLLVVDHLLQCVLHENGEGWRQAFETLETDYFMPLKKALGNKVDRIDLIAPTLYGQLHYTLTPGERWKFWKKPQPIAATAQQLAELAQK